MTDMSSDRRVPCVTGRVRLSTPVPGQPAYASPRCHDNTSRGCLAVSVFRDAAVLDVVSDHLLHGTHARGVYEDPDLTLKGATALREYHLGHRNRFSMDLDFDAEEGTVDLVAEEFDGMAVPHFELTSHNSVQALAVYHMRPHPRIGDWYRGAHPTRTWFPEVGRTAVITL